MTEPPSLDTGKQFAYFAQTILLIAGLIFSNLTYADYAAARIIVGLSYLAILGAVTWFILTFRKSVPLTKKNEKGDGA